MIAMLVTMVPVLLIRYRRFSVRMFVISVAATAVLAIGAYAVPGGPVSKRVDAAVEEIQQYKQGNFESSVGVRLKIWQIGLRYFAEHPWTGVGVGQFARILHASEFCQKTQSMACVLEHAHNDIVEAASTTGIPGLLTFLGIFLIPAELFRRALIASRKCRNERGVSLGAAGLAVVMSSLICGLTQVTTAHQANVVFYAGVVGLLLGLAGREVHEARLARVADNARAASRGASDVEGSRTGGAA
jgi:O-antigen ligase